MIGLECVKPPSRRQETLNTSSREFAFHERFTVNVVGVREFFTIILPLKKVILTVKRERERESEGERKSKSYILEYIMVTAF